ncbi:hypothetical protein NC651_029381 [Populus alba x Populus x berolinensis]|nr:hypothetical protein NC651_029381 [Populus alba x Populus x berolinensis]
MHKLQSADTREEVLYLFSPPMIGIGTPLFTGFSKSGRYVFPKTPSTFSDRLKNLNCTSKCAKQSSDGISYLCMRSSSLVMGTIFTDISTTLRNVRASPSREVTLRNVEWCAIIGEEELVDLVVPLCHLVRC